MNNIRIRKSFSLVEIMVTITVIGILAAMLIPRMAKAQTNITTVGSYTNNPYYGSNSLIINAGAVLTTDPILAAPYAKWLTNSYLNGTNFGGGVINPASVNRRYITFAWQSYSTNSAAAGTNVAFIQESTGVGDWVSIATLTNVLTGTSTNAASTNLDAWGNLQFRLQQAITDETNYTSWNTFSLSSKPLW